MPINFDKALGVHQHALTLRAQRSEILAANIANVDTPNYKARDIDFEAALSKATGSNETSPVHLKRTAGNHINGNVSASGSSLQAELMYRMPQQSSLDGNTVEAHRENAAFTENALLYQTSLQFLGGKFKGLKAAITGGR